MMRIVIVSGAFDDDLADADAILDRYYPTTGWPEAVADAGADSVTVVQRFRRDATFRRGSVEYRFIDDGGRGREPPWFAGLGVAEAVRRAGPTVVHVDGLIFPGLVRTLRWALPRSTAIVAQDHGGGPPESGGARSFARTLLYRFGLGAADGFLFTTRQHAVPWQAAGIIRSRHTLYEVLESSTDIASWPRAAEGGGGLPGRPALLWVGRLVDNKDPLTILDGFARTASSLPDAILTMVYSDDVLLSRIEARIAGTGELRSRVILKGRLEKKALAELYAAADVFVLGSHREVAGFSLLEALSFGVTPVVSDIPSFRAMTDGGRIGALFPPGNPSEFARALERAVQGDALSRRSSVLSHFERELSWTALGRKALDVYRAVHRSRAAHD